MKVTTWNVNGIRAREAQVLDWVLRRRPDVLCLQEIKAPPDAIPESLCEQADYTCFWHGQKGYSGVAITLRREAFPGEHTFFHPEFDHENRVLAVRHGRLVIASVYVPNGGKDFQAKLRFLEGLDTFVRSELADGSELLICGDLNVALEDRDVHPVMRKPGQVGTTDEERRWMRSILDAGTVDLLREFDPENPRLFSWWAPWRNFRQRNFGWRIDYVLASRKLADRALFCHSHREFGTSDHGPVDAAFDVRPEAFLPLNITERAEQIGT